MDDLEPLIILYEEHELCRKSNVLQYLMRSNGIEYLKITVGNNWVSKNQRKYKLPTMFMGTVHFGSLRQFKDFLHH
jgi:hypothetical protein